VQVCPPGAWYRVWKFARRHKAALLTTSAVAFGLLLAVVGLAASLVVLEQKRQQTEAALAREVVANQRERRSRYFYGVALADREWGLNNPDKVEAILDDCPEEFRHWEWGYLRRLCHWTAHFRGHTNQVGSVVFSPAGGSASADSDGNVKSGTPGPATRHIARASFESIPIVMFSPMRSLTATPTSGSGQDA
jgi:hypothetical protein